MRASKGVHLVVPRSAITGDAGLILRTATSVLFVLPWGGHWIIGTTDTDWTLDRSHPAASARDIVYLLDQVNGVLDRPVTTDDIEGVYAGLRPLLSGEDETDLGAVPRARGGRADARADGGGRRQVHDVPGDGRRRDRPRGAPPRPRRAHRRRRAPTNCRCSAPTATPRCGRDRADLARRQACSVGVVEHLLERYGTLTRDVLDLIDARPGARPVRCRARPNTCAAEVVYACAAEGALHVEDVLTRRTRISIETAHRGADTAAATAALMADVLGWDATTATARSSTTWRGSAAERESQRMPDDLTADAARLGAPEVRPGRRLPTHS